jgi:outer membrane protein assembly factor BamD (BamD/ComL family)
VMRLGCVITTFLLTAMCSVSAFAAAERATLVRPANLYLSPDSSSAKMAEVERGRELIILETTRNWVHVEALLGQGRVSQGGDDEEIPEKTITGWVQDRGLVRASLPNGDKILFGEAADSEDEGSRRHGRRGAADDAGRLYYRVYDYFPNSPLAAEALYRAADIRWQIEKADVSTRPSAREKEAFLREGMNEQWMKLVMKKFPGTKWADLAAFHLVDNKLCGDWQGSSKCPEKEAEIYEKYANEHPQSPAAAQALYNAVWRRAALIEIYKTEDQEKKSGEAKGRALALAQKLTAQYPQSDWATRAYRLIFLMEQNVPTYGNLVE